MFNLSKGVGKAMENNLRIINRIKYLIKFVVIFSIIGHSIILSTILLMDPNGPSGLIKTTQDLLANPSTKGFGIVFMTVVFFLIINIVIYLSILLSVNFRKSKKVIIYYVLNIIGIIINLFQINNKIGRVNILVFTVLLLIALNDYLKGRASLRNKSA